MNLNDNQYRIYLKSTREWVAVPEETYQEHIRYFDTFRKRQKGRGECACPKSKFWLCDGDCLSCEFHHASRATHIGYVADTDINVIEALGRDYGVVKRPLSKGSWNGFGRPPFWTEEEVREIEGGPQPEPEPAPPGGFVFNRPLKYGCRGEDVCELKKLLAAAGFPGLTIGNRNYYSKTKKKVKEFQKANGLQVDGKAGPLTIAALGGTYR